MFRCARDHLFFGLDCCMSMWDDAYVCVCVMVASVNHLVLKLSACQTCGNCGHFQLAKKTCTCTHANAPAPSDRVAHAPVPALCGLHRAKASLPAAVFLHLHPADAEHYHRWHPGLLRRYFEPRACTPHVCAPPDPVLKFSLHRRVVGRHECAFPG